MSQKAILFFFIILLTGFSVQAQNRKLSVNEGTPVVIKFAPDFLDFQRVSANTGRRSFVAKVSRAADGKLAVNGRSDWRDAGWAFMFQFQLAKIDKQQDYVEAELRDAATNYKIQFDNSVGDLDAAFNEVAFIGSLDQFTASEYYQKEVVERLLTKTFAGRLAAIPRERQFQLVRDLGYTPAAITSETFLNKFYMSVAFVAPYYDNEIYHESSARAARVKELINLSGTYYKTNDFAAIDGIKWVVKLRYAHEFQDTGYQENRSEWMSVYVPFDLLKKYHGGTLSEQALVNKIRVLVGDSPVKITVPATLGFPYFLGPKGGCYKINTSGTKTYVDASQCG